MLTEGGPENTLNDSIIETKVCRDFLRNVCRRGRKRCKYLHPDDTSTEGESSGRFVYIFCHDYQNTQGCQRDGCKFLHCSSAEEEYYKASGKLPSHVLGHALSKGQAVDVVPGRPGEAPVCKDYLKGECRRAAHCKFRHLTTRQYELEMGYVAPSPPAPPPPPPAPAPVVRYGSTSSIPDLTGPPEAKRFHYSTEAASPPDTRHLSFTRPTAAGHSGTIPAPPVNCETAPPPPLMVLPHHTTFALPPPVSAVSAITTVTTTSPHRLLTPAEARTLILEEENNMLRRRLEELKKQVSDLTVTNEFLLDQNAQLRMGSKRTAANLSALTVPTVSITNGAHGQSLSAQLTSGQTPTPQQMVNAAAAVAAGTLRTVTASVATVPVSIAAVAGTPVSIATVSMAPVSLPPPIVTMSQQTIGVCTDKTSTSVYVPQQTIGVSGQQQTIAISGPQQTLSVSGPQQTLGVSGPQPGLSGPQQTIGVSGPQSTIGVSGPPAPPPPPPQQTAQSTCPQSLPLTISAATAPLVSFPIPVLQTSLSH